ncbi:MAG: acyltransferase family protein [Gammaproteobacteria bacterium]|nr:acyltransferase family protein [Gammaproteobacteria bacterium]
MTSLSTNRIHSMDNLRGILAMLGIPFHASFFLYLYTATSMHHFIMRPNQFLLEPVPAPVSHEFLMAFYLHTFWMPAFFLLAGFFAHLLCENKGTQHFFKNRFFRIGLPFVFYFLWLIPCFLGKIAVISLSEKKNFTAELINNYQNGNLFSYFNDTKSYWFLEYLLCIYLVTLLFLLLRNKRATKKTTQILYKLFSNNVIYLAIPLLCASLFLNGRHWFIMLDENIMPSFTLLILYSLWYFIGWFLWQHKSVLEKLAHFSWQKMLLSFGLYLIYVACYFHFIHSHNEWLYLASILIYNLSMTLAVFGCLGMTWRYLSKNNATLKYLSRASYWLYLTQIPILAILTVTAISLTHSFYMQFISSTLLCVLLCLLTYHFFIRRTWLRRIVG